MTSKRKLRRRTSSGHYDYLLLAVVIALVLYGLLMLYSATFYVGVAFWRRQLLWVGIASLLALGVARIPYPFWKKLATPLMLLTLLSLLFVLIVGEHILGAQRALLGASAQPGILARLVAVIYIATWLASKGELLDQVRYGLVPFAVIVGTVAGLVALQPDLSTALLLIVTGLAMFFFAGGDPLQIFTFMVVGGVPFGLLTWQFSHARERMIAYVASLHDPAQAPYHVHRAITAIGSGGILGVGIGNGQLKSGYLPFPHTDSIFAVVGEEVGLLGALLVLGLFAMLAYRGYRITLSTVDPFGTLVAFGITTMIVAEALLNVMVMVGVVPFTGTALPFFSYGGSEMLVTLTGIGILMNISRGRPKGDWNALLDRRWRDWRTRLSRAGRRASVTGR